MAKPSVGLTSASLIAGRDAIVSQENRVIININYHNSSNKNEFLKEIENHIQKYIGNDLYVETHDINFKTDLDTQINFYYKQCTNGFPSAALDGFEDLLSKTDRELSSQELFKIEANIAQCHWKIGNFPIAANYFEDAAKRLPDHPKSIAFNALTLILRGENKKALEYAKNKLKKHPNNEWLAAYLIYAAIELPSVNDPLLDIPRELHKRLIVMIWNVIFQRNRYEREKWWKAAADSLEIFSNDPTCRFLNAEAQIDQIAQSQFLEVHRFISDDDRVKLKSALTVLEPIWEQTKAAENPNSDYALSALNSIMLANLFLGQKETCLNYAKEIIARSKSEELLTNVTQLALACDDIQLAQDAKEKLPNTGRALFLKGMFEFNYGDWNKAVEFFKQADVPESESQVVHAAIKLADFNNPSRIIEEAELSPFVSCFDDPRALIILAQVARRLCLDAVMKDAFDKSLECIRNYPSLAVRQTVAYFAWKIGNHTALINLLDGIIEIDGVYSKELQWLADAHASEFPHRQRNLKFFEELPKELLDDSRIARAYGSVLSDMGPFATAEEVLRKVIQKNVTDVFAHLKLLYVLRRQKNFSDAASIVRTADELQFLKAPNLAIRWSIELRDSGEHQRALALAYKLVQHNSDNPQVALGYVGLILGIHNFPITNPNEVSSNVFVRIQSSSGDTQSFFIDEFHGQLFGVDCLPINSIRVAPFIGLALGGSIDIKNTIDHVRSWEVVELKSKYLQLLHMIMNEFETRFPGVDGLWRIDCQPGNIQPLLDTIRMQAEVRRNKIEDLYLSHHLPLSIVARSVGSDEVSLSQYLLQTGLDIFCCNGNLDEREAAIAYVIAARGKGVVLDTYTAWMCAEIDALKFLTEWFGAIAISQSTIDQIDRMIAKDSYSRGQQNMSVGWHNGQFVRTEITDTFIDEQISALNEIKAKLIQYCEIATVSLPDDVDETMASISEKLGAPIFDPIFLAGSRNRLLLSDDLHFRNFGALRKVVSTWLQPVLMAARSVDFITAKRYASFVEQLAIRKHKFLSIDANLLETFADDSSVDKMRSFEQICSFLGGPNADMVSHCNVVCEFFGRLRSNRVMESDLNRFAAVALSSVLGGQNNDNTATWAAYILLRVRPDCKKFLFNWLKERGISKRKLRSAAFAWTDRKLRWLWDGQFRGRGDVSHLAINIRLASDF